MQNPQPSIFEQIGTWLQPAENWLSRPDVQQGLMAAGVGLAQPMAFNQNPFGHVLESLQYGLNTAAQTREYQRAQEQKAQEEAMKLRKLALEEKALGIQADELEANKELKKTQVKGLEQEIRQKDQMFKTDLEKAQQTVLNLMAQGAVNRAQANYYLAQVNKIQNEGKINQEEAQLKLQQLQAQIDEIKARTQRVNVETQAINEGQKPLLKMIDLLQKQYEGIIQTIGNITPGMEVPAELEAQAREIKALLDNLTRQLGVEQLNLPSHLFGTVNQQVLGRIKQMPRDLVIQAIEESATNPSLFPYRTALEARLKELDGGNK